MDAWFPYILNVHVLLTHGILLDRSVRMAVDFVLLIDEACTSIFGFGGTLGSVTGAVCGDSPEYELAPCPDDDGKAWDFYDVPVDSHDDFRAILSRDFEAISRLCRPASVGGPQDASSVFGMAFQNLNGVTEPDCVGASKNVTL